MVMAIMIVVLFLVAAVLFGIETIFNKSLVAAGLCAMAVAFALGAWANVA
jgi:hypothetical protein